MELKVGQTVMEVLSKYHHGKDHLQMGKNPITVAEDSGLHPFGFAEKF